MTKRVRVRVSGRVQGVFFRVRCEQMARQRDLMGFVTNLPDGRVEAVFEGADGAVDDAVAWCREGPRGARVEAAEVSEEPPAGEREFRIR